MEDGFDLKFNLIISIFFPQGNILQTLHFSDRKYLQERKIKKKIDRIILFQLLFIF